MTPTPLFFALALTASAQETDPLREEVNQSVSCVMYSQILQSAVDEMIRQSPSLTARDRSHITNLRNLAADILEEADADARAIDASVPAYRRDEINTQLQNMRNRRDEWVDARSHYTWQQWGEALGPNLRACADRYGVVWPF